MLCISGHLFKVNTYWVTYYYTASMFVLKMCPTLSPSFKSEFNRFMIELSIISYIVHNYFQWDFTDSSRPILCYPARLISFRYSIILYLSP